MKRIICAFLLFAFMFTNVSLMPVMALDYYDNFYYPTTTKQTVTETVVTQTTSSHIYTEPPIEQVVVENSELTTGEKVGLALFGTLLVGGIVAAFALDNDRPHHIHHHYPPSRPHRR